MSEKPWNGLTRYQCEWCGRFYWSPLPEDSACPNHVLEHNARLRASIERSNAKLATAAKGER